MISGTFHPRTAIMRDQFDWLDDYGRVAQLAWLDDYSRAALAVESLIRAGGGPGLLLSVDIGGSCFDRIASAAAESTGNPVERIPSLICYRSMMNHHGTGVDASEDATFGRVDGRLESFSDRGLLDSYALESYCLRTQRIDSWARGRPNLLLLHLGDSELLGEQLMGAVGVLAKDRPLVTLYPAGQDRAWLISFFGDLRYRAFDVQMQPVHHDDDNHVSDFGWILVPDEQCSAMTESSTTDSGRRRSDRALFSGHEFLPRQRRTTEVFGSKPNHLPDLAFRLSATEIVACSGCYPVERNGDDSWCWLGPIPRSRLAIPCPLPGRYRIGINAIGSSVQERLAACRVLVGGREVPTSLARRQEGFIEFPAHLDSAGYRGYLEIDLVTPGFRPPVGSDRRFLRLCIASIGVSPWF